MWLLPRTRDGGKGGSWKPGGLEPILALVGTMPSHRNPARHLWAGVRGSTVGAQVADHLPFLLLSTLLGIAELTSMPGRLPYPGAYRKMESLARAGEITRQLRALSVDQAGLRLRDPPASASGVLEFNGVCLGPCLFLTI